MHIFVFLICMLLVDSYLVGQTGQSWRRSGRKGARLRSPLFEQEEAQIFVCTNRWCREKGSDATMATFSFLCPKDVCTVQSVNCLGRCNKGPNARILTKSGRFVEASMVRSVDNIVDLLDKHLDLSVNVTSAEVLRLNYEGNINLRAGKVDEAITYYTNALSLGDKDQEGVLLVMRGTALLQRAYGCRIRHKDLVSLAVDVLPSHEGVSALVEAFSRLDTPLSQQAVLTLLTQTNDIFKDINKSPQWADAGQKWLVSREGGPVTSGAGLLDKATLSWALYQHALAAALEDLLLATVVMPGFAQAWRRAGDVLTELRLFKSAVEYYETAMRLDAGLATQLLPTVERLRMMERLVEGANTKGWPPEVVMSLLEEL